MDKLINWQKAPVMIRMLSFLKKAVHKNGQEADFVKKATDKLRVK